MLQVSADDVDGVTESAAIDAKPAVVPSTRFTKNEVELLPAIWEEQFMACQDKKRVRDDH